jgi:hypothetical protein
MLKIKSQSQCLKTKPSAKIIQNEDIYSETPI